MSLFDEMLEAIREWQRAGAGRTLASLGLTVSIVFGRCPQDGDQWSLWAGALGRESRFVCPDCGRFLLRITRTETRA